jgi:hypothetical protein
MNLFQLNSQHNVEINPEAYTLLPFKAIWDRDKSKEKLRANQELAYIYFIADYKSDFSDILDDTEKEVEVIKNCITIDKWKPDKLVNDAIDFYKKRSSTIALTMLEDAKGGIGKLSAYLRNINFNEVEINAKTGDVSPKHDIKKYADTVRQIPAILAALKELEETVKKEIDAGNSLRGNRKKGMYVDE